jgi:phospholipid/cholesterol/gamma-HCH transport system ATP-binding protein
MLRFEHVHKRFGDKQVLAGVDLTIAAGQVTFIIGQSGTGKSVLMKHAVGLLWPDAGACYVDGIAVTPDDTVRLDEVRKRCSYVFQAGALLDSMTIWENVALPLVQHGGLSLRQARTAAREFLAHVGAAGAAERYPAEVGGGVRKQAAIARALAVRPKCLVLDEPTTSLDPVAARTIDRLSRTLADQDGVTLVVISHDLKSIFGIADHIVFLHAGRIQAQGTPDDFRRSQDLLVRCFLEGRPPHRQEKSYG